MWSRVFDSAPALKKKDKELDNKPPAGQIRFSTCWGHDARKGSCEASLSTSKRAGNQIFLKARTSQMNLDWISSVSKRCTYFKL